MYAGGKQKWGNLLVNISQIDGASPLTTHLVRGQIVWLTANGCEGNNPASHNDPNPVAPLKTHLIPPVIKSICSLNGGFASPIQVDPTTSKVLA